MGNLVPYFHLINGKRFECYASTRSHLTPEGFEHAIITISMEGYSILMDTIGANAKVLKEWAAYWYGGAPGESPKFPKPHPTEIISMAFGVNKGYNGDRCEIQLTIQRGHYILASDLDMGPVDPRSIPSWPRLGDKESG